MSDTEFSDLIKRIHPENIGKLVGYASEAFERLKAEPSAFIAFLEQNN